MDIRSLADTPPWEWPRTAGAEILGVLRDPDAPASDRLLAADMAGELVVMNDLLAGELLSILSDPREPEALRATAAISLGPALEEVDLHGDEDPDSLAVSPAIMERARGALRHSYHDPAVPKEVRRCALEASVRGTEAWHSAAVRAAYYDGDLEWRVTALFCMRFVPGFEAEVMEGLGSDHGSTLYQAILAAKEQGLGSGWPLIRGLLFAAVDGIAISPDDPESEVPLVIAAMEAGAALQPEESRDLLLRLSESSEPEVSDAAMEMLDMLDGAYLMDDEVEDEDTIWH